MNQTRLLVTTPLGKRVLMRGYMDGARNPFAVVRPLGAPELGGWTIAHRASGDDVGVWTIAGLPRRRYEELLMVTRRWAAMGGLLDLARPLEPDTAGALRVLARETLG